MRILAPLGAEDYELCHPVNPDDFEQIHVLVNGEPRRRNWKPIAMRIIREDQGRSFVESDSPWLGGHALIFRPRAVGVLGSLLREYGELLPILCDAEVVLYNPTQVIDALDEGASSVRRFSDGRLMRVNRYVFRPDAVRGIDIFKIPNLRVSPTFVSQRFVDLWNSHHLKGLEFKLLWAHGSK